LVVMFSSEAETPTIAATRASWAEKDERISVKGMGFLRRSDANLLAWLSRFKRIALLCSIEEFATPFLLRAHHHIFRVAQAEKFDGS